MVPRGLAIPHSSSQRLTSEHETFWQLSELLCSYDIISGEIERGVQQRVTHVHTPTANPTAKLKNESVISQADSDR